MNSRGRGRGVSRNSDRRPNNLPSRGGGGGKGRGGTRGNNSYQDEHELVALVKNAQRSCRTWGAGWQEYCSVNGGGTTDPSRHTSSFILQALAELGLPKGSAKEKYVEEVKAIQKTSEAHRKQWTDYCDQHGDGTYDPNFYDESFLRQALTVLETARERVSRRVGGDSLPQLIEAVKLLQRNTNPVYRAAWEEYCQEWGGMLDPGLYSISQLTAGLDFMDTAVNLVRRIKEIAKRKRDKWVSYCDEHGDCVYDPVLHNTEFLRDAYAHLTGEQFGRNSVYSTRKIRRFQKSDPAASTAWKEYCDEHGGGVYDPARQTEEFLDNAVKYLSEKFPDKF
eukprot:TRINITY_DN1471_c0_g1_i1.p1 TRINITY_DN1471_c0_g1~~TRINITY_DN1471_c0_g1_i1.p1  ORF type:complete len:336 (+),score=49.81 TRINITY_DN1471_c0_g1_i1:41-1048(+)